MLGNWLKSRGELNRLGQVLGFGLGVLALGSARCEPAAMIVGLRLDGLQQTSSSSGHMLAGELFNECRVAGVDGLEDRGVRLTAAMSYVRARVDDSDGQRAWLQPMYPD